MTLSANIPGNRIFLIGFMGSGKSHWGSIWAAANGFSLIDLDEAIEKATGTTVVDLFEKKGEDHFREIEAEMLRSFSGADNTIIACGGGTPCFHNNLQWMNEHGTTVYLSSTATRILQHVLDEQQKRPLLKRLNKAELLFFVEQKLKEREPFYSQAKIILNAEQITNDTFKEEILKK